jgi:acetoacetyl-CoA synthetase
MLDGQERSMPDGLNLQEHKRPAMAPDDPVFIPDDGRFSKSELASFQNFCTERTGLAFSDHAAFDAFSVRQAKLFWEMFAEWSELPWEGEQKPAWEGEGAEASRFFPGLRLNYAEAVLAGARFSTGDGVALVSCRADGATIHVTWDELRQRVRQMALALRAHGVRSGDRVGAVLRNDDMAIITCLAVASLGAALSTSAPEMGVEAIASRFSRIDASVIICHGSSKNDPDLPFRVLEVAEQTRPRLGMVMLSEASAGLPTGSIPVRMLEDIPAQGGELEWQRFDFNHPLFVLFSSGTTGAPKCIVHGTGGTLIEHVKEHRLHCDLSFQDRMFFHTSCAWMMWNWQLSALASGTTLVLYDGAVGGPETLWRIVQDQRVTVFGTSPPYLKLCADNGYLPSDHLDLLPLRAILSTGSILRDEQFDWVSRHVKAVPLQSISGGTDIIGCFVLGHPGLPVYRGEAQVRSLGLDVRVLSETGADAAEAMEGELICANPFPSRPVGFLNDPDGSAFHAAYFKANPGVWTHGDLIATSPRRGFRMKGRSDGILNVRGMRVGPAEIYAALAGVTEVSDSLAVEQQLPDGASRIALLVVLQDGVVLDDVLTKAIRKEIGQRASLAHVPAVLAQVNDLPTTHSGKRSERAATDAVNGRPIVNRAALRNPHVLEELAGHPALLALPAALRDTALDADATVVQRLSAIWQRLFGSQAIGPRDDFFHLGGDSIMATTLFALIEREFGLRLPMAVLFQARTVAELACIIRAGGTSRDISLVHVCGGVGEPVFAVHGMSGTVVEQRDFLADLGKVSGRPIYALQARGLDQEKVPHKDIPAMAAHYIAALREVQPSGPYALCGYSFGGLVVYEMALQLTDAGEGIDLLAVLDSGFHPKNLPAFDWLRFRLGRFAVYRDAMAGMCAKERRSYIRQEFANVGNSLRLAAGLSPRRSVEAVGQAARPLPAPLDRVRAGCEVAYASYRPRPFPGPLVLFQADRRDPRTCDSLPLWRRLSGQLKVVDVAGSHHELVVGPYARKLAHHVTAHLSIRPALDA